VAVGDIYDPFLNEEKIFSVGNFPFVTKIAELPGIE
jgi:hypothetical protein